MKNLYSIIATMLIASSIVAQAPQKLSYQAVVRDAGGALVANQTVGMQISVLQSAASGSSVYTETQTPSTNANGLISIELGSGTVVSGTFSAIDWSAGPYFIKTETDPAGGTSYTISGTSQLMSVPYALHAKTAESTTNDLVDDADSDPTNELNTGVVLSGTNLEITDAGGTIVTDLSSLSGGGGSGNWTISGTDISNSNSGNVGIGTTTMNAKLTIEGTMGDIDNGIDIKNGSDDWYIYQDTARGLRFGDDGTDRIVIGPNGNLDVNGKVSLSQTSGEEMVIINGNEWEHANGNQTFGDGGSYFMMGSKELEAETGGIYGDGDVVTLWSPGDGPPGFSSSAHVMILDEDYFSAGGDPYSGGTVVAYINNTGTWQASDINRKENISILEEGSLEKLLQLNGYQYNFKLAPSEIEKGDKKTLTYGVIAQEVSKLFPDMVDIQEDGSHFVNYSLFVPVFIESMKEQQTIIGSLQDELEELKAIVKKMERKLK